MKKFKELGFESKEAVAVVGSLNHLLANYQIHYQKLRNFHWNVEGDDFFELHALFEEEYNDVKVRIDTIAERIRVFGKRPLSTLTSYLSTAEIAESSTELSSEEMVNEIINDYDILLSFLIECYEQAQMVGDIVTADIMTQYVKETEKKHWMLSAFNKQVAVNV